MADLFNTIHQNPKSTDTPEKKEDIEHAYHNILRFNLQFFQINLILPDQFGYQNSLVFSKMRKSLSKIKFKDSNWADNIIKATSIKEKLDNILNRNFTSDYLPDLILILQRHINHKFLPGQELNMNHIRKFINFFYCTLTLFGFSRIDYLIMPVLLTLAASSPLTYDNALNALSIRLKYAFVETPPEIFEEIKVLKKGGFNDENFLRVSTLISKLVNETYGLNDISFTNKRYKTNAQLYYLNRYNRVNTVWKWLFSSDSDPKIDKELDSIVECVKQNKFLIGVFWKTYLNKFLKKYKAISDLIDLK